LKNYPNIEDFLNLLEMAKQFNTEEFVRSEPFSETRIEEVSQCRSMIDEAERIES
jgi:hypothetical protein